MRHHAAVARETHPARCSSTTAPHHQQRGEQFARTSTAARQTISELGERFIHMGMRILVHGYSRVVLALLKQAKLQVR